MSSKKDGVKRARKSAVAMEAQPPQVEQPTHREVWTVARERCRPTQAALGWDWALSKMAKCADASSAQKYMDRKPVPYVTRGDGLMYVLDHHHTLAALELSGWEDVEVTFELVYEFDEGVLDTSNNDLFYGFLSGKGWTYLLDEQYQPISWRELPTGFDLRLYRNDLYRSMGGFCRKYGVLERGTTLEDRLFFEFRWGYLFWLNRNGPDSESENLWTDMRHYRTWCHMTSCLDEIIHNEFDVYKFKPNEVCAVAENFDIDEQVEFGKEVVRPCYRAACWALRDLCENYQAKQPVPLGKMSKLFPGTSVLPGRVLTAPPPKWQGKGSHTTEADV
uniref:ParB-like nuclease n=1 Tax=Prasinoderma singulare TaxID=676789 RepID=A0A7S3F356_9VIRI